MSQFVELSKIQEQVAAFMQSQEAFLKAIETAVANAPAIPDVEVPEQVQSFQTEATKTWVQLGQDSQSTSHAQRKPRRRLGGTSATREQQREEVSHTLISIPDAASRAAAERALKMVDATRARLATTKRPHGV